MPKERNTEFKVGIKHIASVLHQQLAAFVLLQPVHNLFLVGTKPIKELRGEVWIGDLHVVRIVPAARTTTPPDKTKNIVNSLEVHDGRRSSLSRSQGN